jgi:hypothetical protein
MRAIVIATLLAASTLACTEASAACPPNRVKVSTGPNGKTLTLCRDGKYSTCVRDMRRLDWSDREIYRTCDGKREQGRIK